MPSEIQLRRRSNGATETLTLLAPGYSVIITVTVRGLEIDATTLERMLHAPASMLATRDRI